MKTVAEFIGPQEAQKYLKSVVDNRPVRRGHVKMLADLMKRNQFKQTHQGVAFDIKGNLIDGQHRLLAVIESGQIVSMLVTRGLGTDDYRHIDSGLARTVGDRLKLLSDGRANQIACALVRSYLLVTETRKFARFPIDMIENCFLSMDDAFTDVAMRWRQKATGLCRADIGAAVACYASNHPQEAEGFMAGYLTGEGLGKGDPAYVFREALLNRRIAMKTGSVEMYWKAMYVTQKHYAAEELKAIQPATIDWRGNRYDSRYYQTARRVEKAAVVKRAQTLSKKTEEQMRLTTINSGLRSVGKVG